MYLHQRIKYLFNPKNCFEALGNMIRDDHPGSGFWFVTNPGSRIQGSKIPRIRIRNTGLNRQKFSVLFMMNFLARYFLLFLPKSYCVCYNWLRIRKPNADADPATQNLFSEIFNIFHTLSAVPSQMTLLKFVSGHSGCWRSYDSAPQVQGKYLKYNNTIIYSVHIFKKLH